MKVRKCMTAILATAMGGGLALVLGVGPALAGPSGVPFKSAGSGTEQSLSSTGCQFTLAGCTVQSTGMATSSHMGTGSYVSTLTVVWADATGNGEGGYCAPATGTGTITAANGATLNQTETGTVCEVGATGANVPHTFTGTFTDAGGTGRFANATGSGTVTGGDDGSGNSYYQESGTISY
jgi:hypothetical protein